MKKSEILKALNYYENASNCYKRHVAAIIIGPHDEIVQWGANVRTLEMPLEICEKCVKGERPAVCPALHAEIAAFSKLGTTKAITHKYSTIAISYSPCPECCKAIRYFGITRVIVKEPRLGHITIDGHTITYDKFAENLLGNKVDYIRLWQKPEDWEYHSYAIWRDENESNIR